MNNANPLQNHLSAATDLSVNLPSTWSSESESIVIGISGSFDTHTHTNDPLAIGGHHLTANNGNASEMNG